MCSVRRIFLRCSHFELRPGQSDVAILELQQLSQLPTGILAQHRANIVETSYDRAYHNVNLGDTAIDITMETRGPDHIAELISALGANGYTHERIL